MNGQKQLWTPISAGFYDELVKKPFNAKKTRFILTLKLAYVVVGHEYANRTPQAINKHQQKQLFLQIQFFSQI